MTPETDPDGERLLDRAGQGDEEAREQLLALYRDRLWRMVAVRLDRRLVRRLDPSDVVQEALADAARKLPDYLRRRPLPFYPWLREIARERLVKLHRRHLLARTRSVTCEEPDPGGLPEDSALQLAERLANSGTSPSGRLLREEARDLVRAALARLGERDREVLALRYLEQLPTRDIAAVLGVSEGTVKMRHLRALDRLRTLLPDAPGEGRPWT